MNDMDRFERLRDILEARAQNPELDYALIAACADEAGVGVKSDPTRYTYDRGEVGGHPTLAFQSPLERHPRAVLMRTFVGRSTRRYAWHVYHRHG